MIFFYLKSKLARKVITARTVHWCVLLTVKHVDTQMVSVLVRQGGMVLIAQKVKIVKRP